MGRITYCFSAAAEHLLTDVVHPENCSGNPAESPRELRVDETRRPSAMAAGSSCHRQAKAPPPLTPIRAHVLAGVLTDWSFAVRAAGRAGQSEPRFQLPAAESGGIRAAGSAVIFRTACSHVGTPVSRSYARRRDLMPRKLGRGRNRLPLRLPRTGPLARRVTHPAPPAGSGHTPHALDHLRHPPASCPQERISAERRLDSPLRVPDRPPPTSAETPDRPSSAPAVSVVVGSHEAAFRIARHLVPHLLPPAPSAKSRRIPLSRPPPAPHPSRHGRPPDDGRIHMVRRTAR
jgi:hypothetical protein